MIRNSNPIPVTINYDETRVIGYFKPSLAIVKIPDEALAGAILAPQFIKHDDGEIEVTGWSLIDGDKYKKPELSK